MSDTEYKISYEDTQAMLHYLTLHFPEHATPEKAIQLLNWMHLAHKKLEEMDKEAIESVLSDLENY